ncbi:MAG: winged helix-turn-helix domain-containing protein [Devosia sp.]
MVGTTSTFGAFTFDSDREVLSKDGVPLGISHRGAVLLRTLVDAAGTVVEKSALMEAAWPGTFVEEGNLTVQIANLRKTIGEPLIVTVPRVGYRFVAPAHASPIMSNGGIPSVAVLPFVNLGGDASDDYFADGIVEDLITALSRFGTFSVVSRSSSFVYRGRTVDVREAASELGVRYLLEGAVRRHDKRVRVTAKLLDAETGSHLWADKFDGDLDDIFDFQDAITESVVGLIEPKIRVAEIERARRKRPDSLDAYDLYLRALPLTYSMDAADYGVALDLLRRAIALDPGFALAQAHAAWVIEKRLTWGLAPIGPDDKGECLALVRAALLADPTEPIVLAVAGWLSLVIDGDVETALGALRRAAAANPNNLIVLGLWGFGNFLAGDMDEAALTFERALRLSPNAPDVYGWLSGMGTTHLLRGDFEAAIEWGLKSLATYNEWPMTYWSLIPAYAHLDRMDEARAALGRLLAIAPNSRASAIALNPGVPGRLEIMRTGLIKAGLAD